MSSKPKQPPESGSDIETYRLPRWDSRGNPMPEPQGVSSEDLTEEEISLPTAEEIRQIHEDAYNEGFESGYEQGMRQGQADGREQGHQEGFQAGEAQGRETGEKAGFEAARAAEDERIEKELQPLVALLESLKSALPEQEEALKEGLVLLATRIARNVIDAELSLHPDHIVSLAHAAIQALPNADERLIIELHPDDEALVARIAESHWTLESNDKITRGGCVVRTRFSYIDCTLEHRYRQQVSNLLAHLGLSERLTELEQPWPLPPAEAPQPVEELTDAEEPAAETGIESSAEVMNESEPVDEPSTEASPTHESQGDDTTSQAEGADEPSDEPSAESADLPQNEPQQQEEPLNDEESGPEKPESDPDQEADDEPPR